MSTALQRLSAFPWIWSFVAALAAWVVAVSAAGGLGAGAMITAALTFAVFSVFVGIGQMFVMASGPGNVDLSIPATIALSGLVAMKVMNGSDSAILTGIAAALTAGICVGFGNAALIRILRVPPIIATLSASLIVQSIAISFGRGLLVPPPPLLASLTTQRVFGIPLMAIAGVFLAILMAVALHRTVYGRSLLAVGQNASAAELAGVKVWRTRLITYALSGLMAAICGILLSSISGGASLDMGNEYLLTSIALVVIGGTSVSGGRANVTGIWGAALFLFLLVSMLNSLGVGTGWRLVLNGFIIIAVIVAAGGEDSRF